MCWLATCTKSVVSLTRATSSSTMPIPRRTYFPTATTPRPRSGLPDRDDLEAAWHALELVLAPVLELKTRAGDEVGDRSRHHDLAGTGQRRDPLPYVYGDPADVV